MTASLSRPYYAFAEEDQAAACLYLFQDELPNLSSKSNKLDGSFFFYPRMSVSSFSLLVLLYLSYVNLFKELFLLALSNLVCEVFLKSECKGTAFSGTTKIFPNFFVIFVLFSLHT